MAKAAEAFNEGIIYVQFWTLSSSFKGRLFTWVVSVLTFALEIVAAWHISTGIMVVIFLLQVCGCTSSTHAHTLYIGCLDAH